MPEYQFIARLFWIVAGVVAVLGTALWFVVPIRPMFPPYLATAFFAFGYGAYCRLKTRSAGNRPKS